MGEAITITSSHKRYHMRQWLIFFGLDKDNKKCHACIQAPVNWSPIHCSTAEANSEEGTIGPFFQAFITRKTSSSIEGIINKDYS